VAEVHSHTGVAVLCGRERRERERREEREGRDV